MNVDIYLIFHLSNDCFVQKRRYVELFQVYYASGHRMVTFREIDFDSSHNIASVEHETNNFIKNRPVDTYIVSAIDKMSRNGHISLICL
jgi:hypothetical protein